MKKSSLALVLTAALLLSACSGNNGSTQGADIDTLPDNSTSKPVYNDESSDDEQNTIPEPSICFGKGVWESTDRIFTFYDDTSGNVIEKASQTGVGFEYEPDSNGLVFHLGSADSNTYTGAEAVDEHTVILTWEDGTAETLRYLTGREFCGLRAGVWKSDTNTYTFYNESSGSVVDNEYGMGVPFEFEPDNGGLLFHLGNASDDSPATVNAIDENTVELTWLDGTSETLTYAPVTDFDGFKAGTWASESETFVFNDDHTGTLRQNDSTETMPVSYVVSDDLLIMDSTALPAAIACALISADDYTVVIRFSNLDFEILNYVGEAE